MASFKSLNQLLGLISSQDGWRTRQQFNQVVACWFQVVGPVVATHTRPVSLQRRVLQVATSSAAWAQNLAFERRRILEKLNAQIGSSLIDIRFSTAQWHNREESTQPMDTWLAIWQDHPSRLPGEPGQPASQSNDTNEHPEEAFQSWADMVKRRSQHLPLCPRCQCPTPQGELERWSVCALCAVKQW